MGVRAPTQEDIYMMYYVGFKQYAMLTIIVFLISFLICNKLLKTSHVISFVLSLILALIINGVLTYNWTHSLIY